MLRHIVILLSVCLVGVADTNVWELFGGIVRMKLPSTYVVTTAKVTNTVSGILLHHWYAKTDTGSSVDVSVYKLGYPCNIDSMFVEAVKIIPTVKSGSAGVALYGFEDKRGELWIKKGLDLYRFRFYTNSNSELQTLIKQFPIITI